MTSLSVLNNIDLITKQIEQLTSQQKETEREILRLEGSKRVFEQFKGIGIEDIKIPKDIIENNEVIDDTDIHSCVPDEEPDAN